MAISNAGTSLEGFFLIAMPGMEDDRFARSVVYICAHSDNGAMGFVINKPQSMSFPTLLTQLEIVSSPDEIRLPEQGRDILVGVGGPVESGRGFVLHSNDYDSESTVPVEGGISLTPTMDILKAISRGLGPRAAMMVLGYAGWSAGQLESEIASNGWLTCPADFDIVFETRPEIRYERALAKMGVNPAFLASEAGHA
ncbi:YqgE/AlgH family protein [Aureimonas frigidaquae]|uniref:YqgE/AlgH family protein n=1 Tax=Aureimonas frigidaquae TaxID=424757 RepID=UPI000784C3CA|nr:YqgE/AlgH family protein [Aureimonas frigidaquae]